MKNKIISALFIGFTMLTFAQNNKTGTSNTSGDDGKKISKRIFSEIIIGMAVPTGDYASSDIYLEEAGFAVNGGFLFANCGIICNDLFGFEIAFSTGVNPLNKKIDDMLNQAGYPSNTDYDYDYGGWSNLNIMIGPHFSIPVKKFALDLRLLGGYMFLERPFIKQTFNNGTMVAEQKKGQGNGIVCQIGTGLRYSISKTIDIKLSVDHYKANPEVKYQETFFNGLNYTHFDEKKYKQPISSFNYGIGIVFHPK
ncbi:MAG: hypothetical protein K8S16_08280 [Bacteroidales bacterium]|nr:hypothetical protein [Bacteroidales bacterium]